MVDARALRNCIVAQPVDGAGGGRALLAAHQREEQPRDFLEMRRRGFLDPIAGILEPSRRLAQRGRDRRIHFAAGIVGKQRDRGRRAAAHGPPASPAPTTDRAGRAAAIVS